MPRTKDPLEYAIKSTSFKRQTEKQIREKLSKSFPDCDQDAIIDRLKELQYVDDQAYCEAWIHYRSLTSPRGKFVLKRELKMKGVPAHIIEGSLDLFVEDDILEAELQKKWGSLREQDLRKKKEKTMRYLLSRGFGIGDVMEKMNGLRSESSTD